MVTIKTKIIFTLLTISLLASLGKIVFDNAPWYTKRNYWSQYPELERTYKSSQYVNKNPTGWIPDETLYAYAGGYYIQGNNPVLVNVEAPPLGKYIIGLSANFFNNENILIILVAGIGAIIGTIVLGKQIFQSYPLALTPPLLLSFEPLFRNQFKYVPHFDILHMCWLLWSIICFNNARSSNKMRWWCVTAVFIGLFISTKFYMSGVPLVAAMCVVLLFNREWGNLQKYLISLPIAPIILLAMYLRVFAFGYSPREFLGIQKYIYLFWQHKFEHVFSIWPLIYLNHWYVWWGDKPILQESQWRFTWPATVTLALIGAIGWISHKIRIQKPAEVLFAFTVCYLAFLSTGQTISRYLVILQPILYILATYIVVELTRNRHKLWPSIRSLFPPTTRPKA